VLGKTRQKGNKAAEDEKLDSTTDSVHMNLGKLREIEKDREAWQLQSTGSQRVEHDLVSEQQQRKWSLDDLSQGLAWPRVNCLMLICLSVRVCVCVCMCEQYGKSRASEPIWEAVSKPHEVKMGGLVACPSPDGSKMTI